MNPADKMKAEALAIFDGPECPQDTRDVIEWFYSSMLVDAERRANGFMSRATYATSSGAGYKQISFRFAELEDAEQLRIWAESYGAKAGVLVQQEQAGWQLVPVEPTEAMLDAARACAMRGAAFATWNRMLTAAPKGEKP